MGFPQQRKISFLLAWKFASHVNFGKSLVSLELADASNVDVVRKRSYAWLQANALLTNGGQLM
jgi:hypothetical protein